MAGKKSSTAESSGATKSETFLDGRVTLLKGDCLEILKMLPDNSIDSVVCDPPYHLTSIVKRFGAKNAAAAQFGNDGAFARASAGFMGKQWDGGDIAFRVELWEQVYRVLKPGAHLLAFSGTRTYHRMACAIEDAGFEMRDMISWLYGSGFPKSHNQGDGWGTALKPACEPIALARKPLIGTVAENVSGYGTGAINIAACRVPPASFRDSPHDSSVCTCSWPTGDQISRNEDICNPALSARKPAHQNGLLSSGAGYESGRPLREDFQGDCRPSGRSNDESVHEASTDDQASAPRPHDEDMFPDRCAKCGCIRDDLSKPYGTIPNVDMVKQSRWPANVIHDGSEEVLAAFPESAGQQGDVRGTEPSSVTNGIYGDFSGRVPGLARNDSGSAARFFYTAKADAEDRLGSKHPTVKPLDLMQYLVRLVTPKGGTTLDAFAGTGTTGEAAWREGMKAILIEREEEYQADIARRMDLADKPTKRAAVAATKNNLDDPKDLPLFSGAK